MTLKPKIEKTQHSWFTNYSGAFLLLSTHLRLVMSIVDMFVVEILTNDEFLCDSSQCHVQ